MVTDTALIKKMINILSSWGKHGVLVKRSKSLWDTLGPRAFCCGQPRDKELLCWIRDCWIILEYENWSVKRHISSIKILKLFGSEYKCTEASKITLEEICKEFCSHECRREYGASRYWVACSSVGGMWGHLDTTATAKCHNSLIMSLSLFIPVSWFSMK